MYCITNYNFSLLKPCNTVAFALFVTIYFKIYVTGQI